MNVRNKLLQKEMVWKKATPCKDDFLGIHAKISGQSFRVLFKVGMDGMV